MSISNLAIGNGTGYTTTDLSVGRKSQTARMPVPDSDVFDAEEGEFMMKTGERPQFWYSGQWNPMAGTGDLPVFATGSIYLDANVNVPFDTDAIVINFVEQYAENVSTDNAGIRVNHAGYYTVNAQFTLTGMGNYYTDDTSFWIAPLNTSTGQYLTNAGWGTGVVQRKYMAISCSCTAFIGENEYIQLLYSFNSGVDNGSIDIFGGSLGDPANLGLSSFLQVTWAGPATTMLASRRELTSAPVEPVKPVKVVEEVAEEAASPVQPVQSVRALPARVTGIKPFRPEELVVEPELDRITNPLVVSAPSSIIEENPPYNVYQEPPSECGTVSSGFELVDGDGVVHVRPDNLHE